MIEYKLTEHATNVIEERKIEIKWLESALTTHDYYEDYDDGTRHYIKQIEDFDGKFLRVVTGADSDPIRIITVFFDRRLSE